jgi:hypothetical protein
MSGTPENHLFTLYKAGIRFIDDLDESTYLQELFTILCYTCTLKEGKDLFPVMNINV